MKPSGILWITTARNSRPPSVGLTMNPAAMATPSKSVWTPSPTAARRPDERFSIASGWVSSPKWKWGANVCSKRWTPKYPSSTNRKAWGTWVASGSMRTKAAASMNPAPAATK